MDRSENMRRIRSRDTGPEVALRRLLWTAGLRFRLGDRGLAGRPDLVIATRRKVVFVHGCFWHQHRHCVDGHIPKSRLEYWGPKLRRNIQRDRRVRRELRRDGWDVLVVWECEIERGRLLKAWAAYFDLT